MRLIHQVPFSSGEIETYRQLVFNNLTTGMNYVFDAMEDMGFEIAEEHLPHVELIQNARDIREHEPFPVTYHEPLKALWADSGVQEAYGRGNEAALPEKCATCFVPRFVYLTSSITQSIILFP
jgi:guanine nucleotide-binding protein subunit alpha